MQLINDMFKKFIIKELKNGSPAMKEKFHEYLLENNIEAIPDNIEKPLDDLVSEAFNAGLDALIQGLEAQPE